jgi:SAM-dependent methyltransferase
MSVKFPITSKLSSLDLIFPPFHKVKNPQFLSLFDQVRHATTSSQCVTDEKEFDSILHEREFEMHRHSRSPINRIVKYAKDNVNGGRHEQKILDLASTPIDPSVIIAKEIPQVLLYTLSPSRDILKLVSDKVVEENVANVMIQYNELDDLSEFESNSFDLVISCYGLQNVKAPSHLINEIHRVLKPGGRVIAAVWEHSGTK